MSSFIRASVRRSAWLVALGACPGAWAQFPAQVNTSTDLGSLTNGFTINGAASFDLSGEHLAGGDVNGDGIDDLVVGAHQADSSGRANNGAVYVVYGAAGGPSFTPFELFALNGTNGFTIIGADGPSSPGEDGDTGDEASACVATADLNGDTIDDLIIGANGGDGATNADTSTGEVFVVYGKPSGSPFPVTVDLATLAAADGFRILGLDRSDQLGSACAHAGDVNGDGIDDIIIGAPLAQGNAAGGSSNAGEAYVIFGSTTAFIGLTDFDLSTLDGTNGFTVNGLNSGDRLGGVTSNAGSALAGGDINGDTYSDVIVGAGFADPNADVSAGQVVIVFGRPSGVSFPVEISANDLTGSNGFTVNGPDGFDNIGTAVAAGDVDDDGIDDVILGARNGDPPAGNNAGETFVIYGKSSPFAPAIDPSALPASEGFVINGIDASDNSGNSVASSTDINGDGVDDILIGAIGADGGVGNPRLGAGDAYVVFGGANLVSDAADGIVELSDLDGQSGFVLAGASNNDSLGREQLVGLDFNNDGVDDLAVGAPSADPTFGGSGAGITFVVFGRSSCALVDLALPDGVLDAFDIGVFFEETAAQGAPANLFPSGAPDGVFDANDQMLFFSIFDTCTE